MTKLIYKCPVCLKKFTRKWNAQRHNNDIHKDLALIEYSADVKMGLDNRSKIHPYNLDKFKSKMPISKYNDGNTTTGFSTFSYSRPFKSFNNPPQNKLNKSFKSMDEDEKEDLLYNKLEKMAIPFEKLEKLLVLSPHLVQGNGNINIVLSDILITALGKHDPTKVVQNHLSYYSKLYYRNKMILYVSRILNMPVITTIEYLKSLLSENKF